LKIYFGIFKDVRMKRQNLWFGLLIFKYIIKLLVIC
jgi:hypothetical protein